MISVLASRFWAVNEYVELDHPIMLIYEQETEIDLNSLLYNTTLYLNNKLVEPLSDVFMFTSLDKLFAEYDKKQCSEIGTDNSKYRLAQNENYKNTLFFLVCSDSVKQRIIVRFSNNDFSEQLQVFYADNFIVDNTQKVRYIDSISIKMKEPIVRYSTVIHIELRDLMQTVIIPESLYLKFSSSNTTIRANISNLRIYATVNEKYHFGPVSLLYNGFEVKTGKSLGQYVVLFYSLFSVTIVGVCIYIGLEVSSNVLPASLLKFFQYLSYTEIEKQIIKLEQRFINNKEEEEKELNLFADRLLPERAEMSDDSDVSYSGEVDDLFITVE